MGGRERERNIMDHNINILNEHYYSHHTRMLVFQPLCYKRSCYIDFYISTSLLNPYCLYTTDNSSSFYGFQFILYHNIANISEICEDALKDQQAQIAEKIFSLTYFTNVRMLLISLSRRNQKTQMAKCSSWVHIYFFIISFLLFIFSESSPINLFYSVNTGFFFHKVMA